EGEGTGGDLVEEEPGRDARRGLREKGLLAQRREVEADGLDAEGALERSDPVVYRVDASVPAAVLERRPRRVALELDVFVVGQVELRLHRRDVRDERPDPAFA